MDKADQYKNVPDNELNDDQLRIKYWKELLQPSDPRFMEIYGKQIEENEKKRQNRMIVAQAMWEKAERDRRIKEALHLEVKDVGSRPKRQRKVGVARVQKPRRSRKGGN